MPADACSSFPQVHLYHGTHSGSFYALRVEDGSLYPSLHRMEEAGWIKARTVTTEHNRRPRAYELTAAGRRQLGTEEAHWRSVTDAVNYVLKHA